MDITGTQLIAAPRDTVWQALNDPAILKQCLPGCESVELTSPNEFQVLVVATIGPLRARFKGVLRISEANPPQSCTMVFEGQGGAAGFAKGTSSVTLRETPEGTELGYSAQAQIGGKLAQVGSRLIDNVARKMSDDFFKALRQQLAPQVVAPTTPVPTVRETAKPRSAPDAAAAAPTATGNSSPVMVPGWWLAVAALLGCAITLAGAHWLR